MDPQAARRRLYQAFARAHGRMLVKTKGRPRWLGRGQAVLVLETTGRRSGQLRAVPLLYMPHGEHFVVLASNYGQERPPAWWHNLQARPHADVLWSGRRLPVQARAAEGDEREALVHQAREYCAQWREYLTTVDREIPIVVLHRRDAEHGQA